MKIKIILLIVILFLVNFVNVLGVPICDSVTGENDNWTMKDAEVVFRDVHLYGDLNKGGNSQCEMVTTNDGQRTACLIGFHLGSYMPNGSSLTNFTQRSYINQWGSGDYQTVFKILNENFIENNLTGQEGNVSALSNNYTTVKSWYDDTNKDLLSEYYGNTLNSWKTSEVNVYHGYELNYTDIQTQWIANNNGWVLYYALQFDKSQSEYGILMETVESAGKEPIWEFCYEPPIENVSPDLDILTPDNDTIFNTSPQQFVFNVTDNDIDTIDCHLSDSNGNEYDSIYNVPYTVNQTLNATVTEDNYVFQIDCDDGTVNTTKYRTIIYDVTDANTIFYEPLINSTTYENNFYYLIWINDTNLYSSNVTIFNLTNGINNYVYENYTEDYNTTNQNLSDLISLVGFGDGDYEICIDVCDGHTDNIFNKEYEIKNNILTVDNDNIEFIGEEINSIEITELYDRLTFNINMKNEGQIEIVLPDTYHKVSNSKYNGHFVNGKKKLWIDTSPFSVLYYYYNSNKLHIVLNLQSGINSLNSIGQLNCDKNCLNFFIDEHEPDIIYKQYLQNDNITYDTSLITPFIYQVSHQSPSSIKIHNCTLYSNITETVYTGNELPIITINETQYGTPNIQQNTNQTLTTWLIDYKTNMTITYHINCSDSTGHQNTAEEIITFYTEALNISISLPPEPINDTSITTPEAIDKIRRPLTTFILILIWVIFLVVSYVFGGSWFFFFTGIFGILIVIEDTFNNTWSFRIMFLVINLFIILYTTFIYEGGVNSK